MPRKWRRRWQRCAEGAHAMATGRARSLPPRHATEPIRSLLHRERPMADDTTSKNRESAAPTAKKLDDLYKLIDGIEIAMFTTRRPDGHLVSRPMATQERVSGADLWFVTDVSSNKLDELQSDPHVNLAYYHVKSREWVSVAGTATITQD